MSRILVVNGEESTLAILSKLLKTEGYKIRQAGSIDVAKNMLMSEDFNLLITSDDTQTDPELSLLELVKNERPDMPIVVITTPGAENEKLAGHQPFATIEKPLKVDRLLATVQKAVDYGDSEQEEKVNLNLQLETSYEIEGIVAESPVMRSVCNMVSRVAATDVTVMIAGEKGTGKSAMAQAVHARSQRKGNPFVTVLCEATTAEELFGTADQAGALERAGGGTIFLRDVEGLAAPLQGALFNAFRDRKAERCGNQAPFEVTTRIVASTSTNLDNLAADGSFNSDLHKYLKIIFLKIPALRDRKQDIMPLVRQILRKKVGESAALPVLDQKATEILERYDWPGNVAQLDSVLGKALEKTQGNTLTANSLAGLI